MAGLGFPSVCLSLWLLFAATGRVGAEAPLTPGHQGSDKLLWESPCQQHLRQLQCGAWAPVLSPARLHGCWVSTGCEVRPGPEFITRSYTFSPSLGFKAFHFHYANHQCSEPTYTLVIRGRVRLGRSSWVTRGGTEAEYQLHRVGVVFHSAAAAAGVWGGSSCGPPGEWPWAVGATHELLNVRTGRDCTAALGFAAHELSLVRVERRQRGGRLVEELFLGDIHTQSSHRLQHRPKGYQRPLQNALHHDQPCAACRLLYRSDERRPPVLRARPEEPVRLRGRWVSERCEVRPAVLFLTRSLHFPDPDPGQSLSWEANYSHYTDPSCRQPAFLLSASGSYSQGGPSRRVSGGTEFTFRVTRVGVTPLDAATASLLKASRAGWCGEPGAWAVGREQDLTPTRGCRALGLRLPHTEYELLRMETDLRHRRLLWVGERPTNGSSPGVPEGRPTSYQAPLVQCSAGKTPEPGSGSGAGAGNRQNPEPRSRSGRRADPSVTLLCGLLLLVSLMVQQSPTASQREQDSSSG